MESTKSTLTNKFREIALRNVHFGIFSRERNYGKRFALHREERYDRLMRRSANLETRDKLRHVIKYFNARLYHEQGDPYKYS